MYYKSEYIGKTVSASQWLNFLYQLNRTTIIGSNFLTRNSLTLHSFSKHVRFNAYLSSQVSWMKFNFNTLLIPGCITHIRLICLSFICVYITLIFMHAKANIRTYGHTNLNPDLFYSSFRQKANVCSLCQLCKKVIKFSCVTHVCKILKFRWQIKVKLSLSSDGMTWVCV